GEHDAHDTRSIRSSRSSEQRIGSGPKTVFARAFAELNVSRPDKQVIVRRGKIDVTGLNSFAHVRVTDRKPTRTGEEFCQQTWRFRGSVYHYEERPGKALGEVSEELV